MLQSASGFTPGLGLRRWSCPEAATPPPLTCGRWAASSASFSLVWCTLSAFTGSLQRSSSRQCLSMPCKLHAQL